GSAPANLFGAAEDQVSDEHADAKRHGQGGREVVLHQLLRLVRRIDGATPGVTRSAVLDRAEGGGEVPEIVAHAVELVVDVLCLEFFQESARLVFGRSAPVTQT